MVTTTSRGRTVSFTYEHPRPALTVDCAVFGVEEETLKVLLIQRDLAPFRGRWALPGGFVEIKESLDEAARRELKEETGVERVYVQQLSTFGDVDRDPRDRVVSVAYYALVKFGEHRLRAATDARKAAWFAVGDVPSLAFDHDKILRAAVTRLRRKLCQRPVAFELLPSKFTLSQLQRVYETIFERELDKRNFRKKILSMNLLVELDEVEQKVAHRAARLYRVDRRKYREFDKQDLNFGL